jgi:uncharacterized protein (TIRG00374 family)
MKLRNILFIFGILGLALVVLLNGHQLDSFWLLLKSLRWYIVILIVLIQLASYYLNALYYRSILKVFSRSVKVERLFEGALAANFVNYIIPTMGLAGAGYLSQVLSPEVPRGESVLAQLMRYALSGLAVLTLMPVGFILILFTVHSGQDITRATLVASLVVIALAILVIILIEREMTLRRFANWLTLRLKRLSASIKIESTHKLINEFYIGYRIMTKHKRKVLPSYGWSIIYIVVEVATFYLTFLAFGKAVNPGIVIMAYLFANIASIFGGVIFSIGVFEIGMTGTLVALGLPFVLALSATTVYRILNLIIGLPPGFYFYKKYLPKT